MSINLLIAEADRVWAQFYTAAYCHRNAVTSETRSRLRPVIMRHALHLQSLAKDVSDPGVQWAANEAQLVIERIDRNWK